MIDQDGDGRVTEEDLKVMLSNLGMSFLHAIRHACPSYISNLDAELTDKCVPGQTPTPTLLDSLLSSRPGGSGETSLSLSDKRQGINFTQFLAMMGEHLLELDPEEEMVEAFACFDDGDKGYVDIKEMRKHLGEMGDRMEDWEVSSCCFRRHTTFWIVGWKNADRVFID